MYEVFYSFSDGKQAMTIGPGTFNKRASETYAQLSVNEKGKLKTDAEENPEYFSRRDILRRGETIFKKIQKLVGLYSNFFVIAH